MQIRMIVAPYDTGRRDFRMGGGPARLLAGGLEAVWREHGHTVSTEWLDVPAADAGDVRTAFDLYAGIATRVRAVRATGAFPLVLAGNCGATIGAMAGLAASDLTIVWCDAHGDLNTPETSPSGFLDGMVLAVLTGRCWRTLAAGVPGFVVIADDQVVLVGARDLDPAERRVLESSRIRMVPPDLTGLDAALPPAGGRSYLHLDLDVLDPAEGRANQFAAPGGASRAALQSLVRRVSARTRLAGAAITAYDPAADPEGRVVAAACAVCDTLAGALTAS